MTPAERYWSHIQALRHVYEGMASGPGRERVKARYEAALADYRAFTTQPD